VPDARAAEGATHFLAPAKPGWAVPSRHLPSAIRHLSSAISPSPFPIPNSAFRIFYRKGPPTFWHPANVVGPFRAAFAIRHPAFVICHFSFPIPRSAFRIPHFLAEGPTHFLTQRKRGWPLSTRHLPSAIRHPPFVICHFSFPIPRSAFRIF